MESLARESTWMWRTPLFYLRSLKKTPWELRAMWQRKTTTVQSGKNSSLNGAGSEHMIGFCLVASSFHASTGYKECICLSPANPQIVSSRLHLNDLLDQPLSLLIQVEMAPRQSGRASVHRKIRFLTVLFIFLSPKHWIQTNSSSSSLSCSPSI